MTRLIESLWKLEHYREPLVNLILKSGGRYVMTKEEISAIISKTSSDAKIYKKLRKYAEANIKSRQDIDYIRSRTRRAKIRFEEISKISKLDLDNVQRYLDFGAGDCSMAVLLGKLFEVDDVYAIDIQEWEGSLQDPGLFRSKCKFKAYDGKRIPFKANSFDLITAFQVLHHIEYLEEILKEIYRVLCEDGIFIIREHNSHNNKMSRLIEIEHELHNRVFNLEINDKEAFSCYRPKNTLKQLIIDAGFKYVGQYCMKDPIWNPTRYYYQAYTKN